MTLDPDVEVLIRTAMKERGLSFKDAVNLAIRSGLTQGRQSQQTFVQKTYSMGGEQLFRWDKALEAASLIEDEEQVRKISLRK